jgi:hypothetical protein
VVDGDDDPRDQGGDDGVAEDQRNATATTRTTPDGAQARDPVQARASAAARGRARRRELGVPDAERIRFARGSARRCAGSAAC